jgi:VanZ family protein
MVPRVLWWLTSIAWAAEIFYLSTPAFGGSLTQSLLAQMLDSLHLCISSDVFDLLDTLFRKLAHLTEYAIFSLLLYVSLVGQDRFRWRPRLAYWCVVTASAYSLTDELHQVFSPGRHASLIDCGIDTSGAAIAMLLVYGSSRISATFGSKGFAQ